MKNKGDITKGTNFVHKREQKNNVFKVEGWKNEKNCTLCMKKRRKKETDSKIKGFIKMCDSNFILNQKVQ